MNFEKCKFVNPMPSSSLFCTLVVTGQFILP